MAVNLNPHVYTEADMPAFLPAKDRQGFFRQLCEIRQLPETTRCPLPERSWGK